jgi:bacillopeptidase F (M6 metalloprotease family)
MNTLQETNIQYLARWVEVRCDGKWEHQNGITLQNTDNPGWLIRIKSAMDFPLGNEAVPFDLSEGTVSGLMSADGIALYSPSLDDLLNRSVQVLTIRDKLNSKAIRDKE